MHTAKYEAYAAFRQAIPIKTWLRLLYPRLSGRYIVGNAVFLIHDNSYQRMFNDEIHQVRNMYIFSGESLISAKRPIDVPDEVILKEISGVEGSNNRNITFARRA